MDLIRKTFLENKVSSQSYATNTTASFQNIFLTPKRNPAYISSHWQTCPRLKPIKDTSCLQIYFWICAWLMWFVPFVYGFNDFSTYYLSIFLWKCPQLCFPLLLDYFTRLQELLYIMNPIPFSGISLSNIPLSVDCLIPLKQNSLILLDKVQLIVFFDRLCFQIIGKPKVI
jgi:hypothetical protein